VESKKMNIRSSALPKLALCAQFEGAQGEPSEAATRGLRLDAALRQAWTTGEVPPLSQEEAVAVAWSFEHIDQLRRNSAVEMREEFCKILVPIIDYTGTADAICAEKLWIADLKSGQVRNYREQMAAYCLGLMTQHMESEWTYHLLFCDQQQVVSETLSFREAYEIVFNVVKNLGDPPKANEYCGWCSKSLTCSERVTALELVNKTFEVVLNDPNKLGEFLDKCRVLDDFRAAAEDQARKLLDSGFQVAGWRLQKGRTTETVSVETQISSGLYPLTLLDAHGPLSAKKFRELVGEGVEFPVISKTSKPSLTKIK
jgi:hypothetical protein